MLTVTLNAQEPGNAAAVGTSVTRSDNWEKWVFTGSSFTFFAAGLAVLFSNGINGSSTFDPFTPSTPSHN